MNFKARQIRQRCRKSVLVVASVLALAVTSVIPAPSGLENLGLGVDFVWAGNGNGGGNGGGNNGGNSGGNGKSSLSAAPGERRVTPGGLLGRLFFSARRGTISDTQKAVTMKKGSAPARTTGKPISGPRQTPVTHASAQPAIPETPASAFGYTHLATDNADITAAVVANQAASSYAQAIRDLQAFDPVTSGDFAALNETIEQLEAGAANAPPDDPVHEELATARDELKSKMQAMADYRDAQNLVDTLQAAATEAALAASSDKLAASGAQGHNPVKSAIDDILSIRRTLPAGS